MSAPSPPLRADGRRNRRRLLVAAGELLAAGEPFTLADVAAAAGLATATAYRHFRSADDVTRAFAAAFHDDVGERLERAAGPADLDRLGQVWVETVLAWGPAVARLRSPEGFLARRRGGDPTLGRLLARLEPAVEGELATVHGRAPSAGELAHALAVWNALADPREILDRSAELGWSAGRIAGELRRAVVAVMVARG